MRPGKPTPDARYISVDGLDHGEENLDIWIWRRRAIDDTLESYRDPTYLPRHCRRTGKELVLNGNPAFFELISRWCQREGRGDGAYAEGLSS